jgi:hypothetical protein
MTDKELSVDELDVLLVGEKHLWAWDDDLKKNVCVKCGAMGRHITSFYAPTGAMCSGLPKEGS